MTTGITTFFRKIMVFLMAFYMMFVGYVTGNNSIPNPNDYDLMITLSSNPTTGFTWEYEFDNEGIVEMKDNVYIASSSGNLVGSGGTDYFCFNVIGDGSVKITFTYGQHWDGGTMVTQTVYECTVIDGELQVDNHYSTDLAS